MVLTGHIDDDRLHVTCQKRHMRTFRASFHVRCARHGLVGYLVWGFPRNGYSACGPPLPRAKLPNAMIHNFNSTSSFHPLISNTKKHSAHGRAPLDFQLLLLFPPIAILPDTELASAMNRNMEYDAGALVCLQTASTQLVSLVGQHGGQKVNHLPGSRNRRTRTATQWCQRVPGRATAVPLVDAALDGRGCRRSPSQAAGGWKVQHLEARGSQKSEC